MLRRTFLALPAMLCAQTPPGEASGLRFEWIEAGGTIPGAFANESLVFPRAYTCCPDMGAGRRALVTSRFPHALREIDDPLSPLLANAGETVTVMTAESADGNNSPEEHSIHVPLAIRWPGKLAPRTAAELLISHADILPSLLALAGIDAPLTVQGRNLSQRMAAGQGEVPDSVYIEGRLGYTDEWRAVVRGYDKIVWNTREEIAGLYNLADDPAESQNLNGKREHELMRDSMWALAKDWMRRLGDGMDASGLRLRL